MKHDIWYEYMNKYCTKTQFVDKDYHFELVLEISNQTKILKSMWPNENEMIIGPSVESNKFKKICVGFILDDTRRLVVSLLKGNDFVQKSSQL